jgi:CubicO group peptidase (beta-lactamase class C family)
VIGPLLAGTGCLRTICLVGQLYVRREQRLVSAEWIARSFAACPVQPDYGYLWWRNDNDRIMPGAPRTGRCARGNGGRHVLWIDPVLELVIASHWTEGIAAFVRDVALVVASR